ncbi:hypothetical protein BJV82DRAFT_605258 [Fennellomyces sp. T-0311]|nr:hypothetical protein BJV82DRAFT_605258 [Fennellomyces sp. T-0311]
MMTVVSIPKKDPCIVCKFSRKKCIWEDDKASECDRCRRIGLECLLSDDSYESMELYTTEDGDNELQAWQATVDQLDSDMKQHQQIVAQTWWQSSLEWTLTLTHGVLQLETPIRSMEELYMFTQASIRYLSPFSGLFMKQAVRFQSTSLSFTFGISSVVQRKELMNPRKRRLSMLDYNYNNSDVSLLDHRAIVDRLVMLYLDHYNPYLGLVHRATFLEHYHNMSNPMDSALVLAVCIDTLHRVRHRISYTPYEISMISEMLYSRCRDMLFDMYEDAAKKVEIVVITSLITKYTAEILLNQLECNRLVTVALLICTELAGCRTELTPVQWVLLQRNYVNLQLFNRQHKMLYEDKVDYSLLAEMGDIEVLDDEPEVTRTTMHLVNEVFHFIGSPYITSLLNTVNKTFYGESCEILIEDIVRYEPMVKTWWDSLPPHFRICDDPFTPNGYKLVAGKVPATYLAPFIALHLMTGLITSSILQPHVMATSENAATAEAIQVIRRRLVSLALNSCRVAVYALNENWIPGVSKLPSFGLNVIIFGTYFMEKLSGCDDIEFPLELLNMMKRRLESKSKTLIPLCHQVPLSSSLLRSYRENTQRTHLEIYESYPLPGFALLSDILFSSINGLAEQHLKVLS